MLAIITAGKTRLHWQNKVSQRIKLVHFSFRILVTYARLYSAETAYHVSTGVVSVLNQVVSCLLVTKPS